MNKHIAERWVDALRSGQYEQGIESLHPDPESYCCLGVLCDLYRVEQGRGEWTHMGEFDLSEDITETAVLPGTVRDWAGMETSEGQIPGSEALAALNDAGATFSELADLIEQKWEVL